MLDATAPDAQNRTGRAACEGACEADDACVGFELRKGAGEGVVVPGGGTAHDQASCVLRSTRWLLTKSKREKKEHEHAHTTVAAHDRRSRLKATMMSACPWVPSPSPK